MSEWRFAIDMRNFTVEDVGQLLLGMCFSSAAGSSAEEEEVIGLNGSWQPWD